MAEAIIGLCPNSGWADSLTLVDKRRAHTVMQVVGSGLAIAGSIIMALTKPVNWDSLHGQFGKFHQLFCLICIKKVYFLER